MTRRKGDAALKREVADLVGRACPRCCATAPEQPITEEELQNLPGLARYWENYGPLQPMPGVVHLILAVPRLCDEIRRLRKESK